MMDNEISETNLEKVKLAPSDDVGGEVSVTINITEYTGQGRPRQTARQDYGAPASEASLPDSCYTSTTCTASCGPGFLLVIPNTGVPDCASGVLQVLPCDPGPCPRPCSWSTWTSWSDCQAAPGQLDCTQARTREVARQEVECVGEGL